MGLRGPQVIRISDEQVVLRRGVHELLVSGPEAAEVVGLVVDEIGRATELDRLLDAIPEWRRPAADQLLQTMRARRLVEQRRAPDEEMSSAGQELRLLPQHAALYETLDKDPSEMAALLASATVHVVGRNRTSHALVQALNGSGVGTLRVEPQPVLDNDDLAADGTPESLAAAGEASLVVATSDSGRHDALFGVQRIALHAGTPFLPVWVEGGRTGRLGPLVVPHETACLRCCVDGQNAGLQAVDEELGDDTARISAAAVCGAMAAMEVIKFLTGCAPSGLVGRAAVVRTTNGGLTARRVLKRPRCPECSEVARRRVPSVLVGPQIPDR
jgi:hypothetical protein